MGHTCLGRLPNRGEWKAVIAALGDGGAEPEGVASSVLKAAQDVLAGNHLDEAVEVSVLLLVRLVQAAATPEWQQSFLRLGIDATETSSATHLVAKCVLLLRDELRERRCPVLSQTLVTRAFAETLTRHVRAQTESLFDHSPEDARNVLASLNRGDAFGRTTHHYFAALLRRTVAYFTSKELLNHVGQGKRFSTIADAERFESQGLAETSYETARVVREFAADWYGGRLARGGPVPEDVAGFAAYATDKVLKALPDEGEAY